LQEHTNFKILREKSSSNVQIEGCKKCYNEEKVGIMSLRKMAQKEFSSITPNSKPAIRYIELFLSDVCNLKCIMCKPSVSTKWREDYKKLHWPLPAEREPIDYLKIIDNVDELLFVKFVGGEPLLAKDHLKILEHISHSKNVHNITLKYNSNCTILPSQKIIDLWSKFKEIIFTISIDGVGDVNSYIRYPSNWNNLNSNIITLSQLATEIPPLTIKVLTTISVFNIWSIRNIETWFKEMQKKYNGLKTIGYVPLVQPSYLSIRNIPYEFRPQITEVKSKTPDRLKNIFKWLENAPFNNELSELKNYINKIDNIRELSGPKIIPELNNLI
jgi:sulfatase maturation enzyme AslB (radical SAM superfamily)